MAAAVIERWVGLVVVALAGCSQPTGSASISAASGETAASSLQAVLEGDRDCFDDAVAQLYANRSNPSSAAALARLLNLPLSEGDLRYASLQRSLYEGLLATPGTERDARITRSFFRAATAAEQYQRGHPVRALGTLRRLERDLEDAASRTGDLDLHAMLGNYAHQTGGLIPLRREHRYDLAREHLEVVVQRFDELSLDAQGVTLDVPGVRPVFAMWWAELLRREGDPQAEAAFALVREAVADAEDTPALRVVGHVARAPSRADGPLWPHGYDSCIACHSRTRSISEPVALTPRRRD